MNIMKYILFTAGALAVLIVVLCIFLYNRRLDKIAKGEARGTHTSVPEPKMIALVVYMTFMFLIMWVTLINSQRVTSQSDNYITDIMDLKSEIADLRQEIEENSTHFRRVSYVLRNPDFKEMTADVCYTVELKEYSEDTKVIVNADGTDVTLDKYMPGLYNGSFRTDIFKTVNNVTVKITDDGRTVTEEVDDLEGELFWNFIPNVSTSYRHATTNITFGKLAFEGQYCVEIDCPEDIELVKVTYMAGDTDLRTIDITEDVISGNTITCDKITTEEKSISFRYEVITKSGLKLVEKQAVSFNDSPGYPDNYTEVYDPDGNLIFNSSQGVTEE